MRFDAAKFLTEEFGVPAQLIAMLKLYMPEPPPPATVDKWYRRGSIPSAWLPVLLAVKELETGAPIGLAEYIS